MSDPTPSQVALFRAKRLALCLKRSAANALSGPPYLRKSFERLPLRLARSATPLFTSIDPRERRLMLGKIHNLRRVCQAINGVIIPAGQTFSFWRLVGKCTKRSGYVAGRELQQGCIVPAIGGGICQLSNTLHRLALETNCEVLERHPHTAAIPGLQQDHALDATVAWNYIDLRFAPPSDVQISAHLTSTELMVEFLGASVKPTRIRLSTLPQRRAVANSCETCGHLGCHRHDLVDRSVVHAKTAALVSEHWPEFAAYLATVQGSEDELCLPLAGSRYPWPVTGYAKVHEAKLPTLLRSWKVRKLGSQGALRQKALLNASESLAKFYDRSISSETTHLIVSLDLLPFLWKLGTLGGRTFDVLVTRQPLGELQRRLDEELQLHHERHLLGDFRAPDRLVEDEAIALGHAVKLITPHRAFVADDARKVPLDWILPRSLSAGGPAIAFPGPTISRKGAYEVRDIAREFGLEVVLLGSELEGPEFWRGVRTRRANPSNWLEGVGMVVQPATLEDKPRRLLQAVASGVPVICTDACGLKGLPGVTSIGQPNDLRDAYRSTFQQPCNVLNLSSKGA